MSLLLEATERGRKLEGPEEVVCLLERVTNGPNLVDEILNAVDTLFTEGSSNDGVVIESESLSVDLAVASLVDEFADGIAGWVAICHIRLNHADHVDRGTVQLDEDTVVKLS